MSGHSKWASIRHKKGANDAKRGKLFTKVIKEITVAARMGGGDENSNPRLRAALLKAKSANMPKDNVDRAIKKGTGELEGVNYEELTYEAYGPGGVAILINCLTDNRNRTAADVRSILTKNGGNMGEAGCVSYLFQRKGVIAVDSQTYSEDEVFEAALEAGADDVLLEGEQLEVITPADGYHAVLAAFESAGFEVEESHLTMRAQTSVELPESKLESLEKLIDALEDLDDVQEVHSNAEFPILN